MRIIPSLMLLVAFALAIHTVQAEEAGALLIVGGSATPEAVYEAFFNLAGADDSHLVHIPTATAKFESIPDKAEYYAEWFQRPKQSFTFVHTRQRVEAETEAFAAPLRRATGVWIGGGDQNVLNQIYGGTPVEAALSDVVRRGGVVAGTSSGAAIMSDIMISDETQDSLFVAYGLRLCPQTLVDCHFTERQRLPRMLRFLHHYPAYSGIGVDERTALILQAGRATVIGQGRVSFFHADRQGAVRLAQLRASESCMLNELRYNKWNALVSVSPITK